MRTILSSIAICVVLLLAGCASTPQDRISQHRDAYSRFPSDVQRKISAGQVDVGFTPEMVEMALGKPGRVFSRSDVHGQSEVWVYFRQQPRFSFGIGVGTGSYHRRGGVATGVGVSTSTGGYDDDEAQRVIFQDGRVIGVETVSEVR